jgi:hypothetical protein
MAVWASRCRISYPKDYLQPLKTFDPTGSATNFTNRAFFVCWSIDPGVYTMASKTSTRSGSGEVPHLEVMKCMGGSGQPCLAPRWQVSGWRRVVRAIRWAVRARFRRCFAVW